MPIGLEQWRMQIGALEAQRYRYLSRASRKAARGGRIRVGRISGGCLVGIVLCVTLLCLATSFSMRLLLAGDVERNPGPLPDELLSAVDNSELAADDLRAVYKEVHTLAGRWRAMCLSLGLSDSETEITAAIYPNNPHDCFREVILKWLKKVYNFQQYGPPTWRMLIEAVADPAGGNDPALAEKIAKAHQVAVAFPPTPSNLQAAVGSSGRITIPAHQQQQLDPQETQGGSTEDGSHASSSGLVTDKGYHSETASTTEENQFPYLDMTGLSQEEKNTLKGRLQEESIQIMLKFQGLVDTFQESLEHRNVPVERLASRLSLLGALTGVRSQRPLLEDCLPQIRDAPNIDHALWNLRHYYSFFNYHVIEHIIKGLGTNNDKSNLQKYKEDLKQYSKRRCYECPSCLAQPNDVGTKLILKLDVSFEPYSVEQLQIFKCRLSQILQISEGALKLCYIEEGCIQLTFQIPSFMEKEIFPLSYEEETALINEGVLDLRCGEYEFSAKAWKSANSCTLLSMKPSRRAKSVAEVMQMAGPTEKQLKQTLKNTKYQHAGTTAKHVFAVTESFRDLKASIKEFVQPRGKKRDLMQLHGTVPVWIRGTIYNIPVRIWLECNYPHQPPIVYINPVANMALVYSEGYIDMDGRVQLPYLSNWSESQSDLTTFVQMMCARFSQQCPVYSLASNTQPVPTSPSTPFTPPTPPMHTYPPFFLPTMQPGTPVPHKTQTLPGRTQILPGQTQMMPGQSQTRMMPGQTQMIPGQTQTRMMPGQSQMMPGQARMMPGQTQMIPGQTQMIPGQTQTRMMPGQSQMMPGQARMMPGQTQMIPGQTQMIPGQTQTFPGQSRTMPHQIQMLPGQTQIQMMPGQASFPEAQASQTIAQLQNKSERKQKEIKELQKNLKAVLAQLEDERKTHSQLQTDARNENARLLELLDQEQEKNKNYQQQLNAAIAEHDEARREIAELKIKLEKKLDSDLSKARMVVDELSDTRENLQQKFESAAVQYLKRRDSELGDAYREVEQLRETHSALQLKFESAETENQKKVAAANEELQMAQEQVKQLEEKLAKVESERQELFGSFLAQIALTSQVEETEHLDPVVSPRPPEPPLQEMQLSEIQQQSQSKPLQPDKVDQPEQIDQHLQGETRVSSEQAELQVKLEDALKQLQVQGDEVSGLSQMLDKARSEIEHLNLREKQLLTDTEELHRKLNDALSEIEKEQAEANKLQQRLAEVDARIEQFAHKEKQLEGEKGELQQQKQHLIEREDELRKEIEKLQQKVAGANTQIEQFAHRERQLEEEKEELQQQKQHLIEREDERRVEIEELQLKVAGANTQIDQLLRREMELQDESKELQLNIDHLLAHNDQQLEYHKAEIEEMQQNSTEYRPQTDQLVQTKAESEKQMLDEAEAKIGQLLESEKQLQTEKQELAKKLEELQKELAAQQSTEVQKYVVSYGEVELSLNILGTGAWGYVVEGKFRGKSVAVKCLHESILSSFSVSQIQREIIIMAELRHPNLVLFIAAIFDAPSGPIIITELLGITLRKAYDENKIESSKLPILHDVASALNYLHLHHKPIIHRDVSSSNILLEQLADRKWRAKLSDFGSANLVRNSTTPGAGAIVYAAPELKAGVHKLQAPSADVYSYGILVCEVATSTFPNPAQFPNMLELVNSQWPSLLSFIHTCTQKDPEKRPTMKSVIKKLDDLIVNGLKL